jgi:hypothetical protein
MHYIRELEPIAATFLDIFGHQLKAKTSLRDINDSRVFEQLAVDLQAIRDRIGAEKATRGTWHDYLWWFIERNSYIDSKGTFQTQRQVQVPLDEVYISLRAQREEAAGIVDRGFSREREGTARELILLMLHSVAAQNSLSEVNTRGRC